MSIRSVNMVLVILVAFLENSILSGQTQPFSKPSASYGATVTVASGAGELSALHISAKYGPARFVPITKEIKGRLRKSGLDRCDCETEETISGTVTTRSEGLDTVTRYLVSLTPSVGFKVLSGISVDQRLTSENYDVSGVVGGFVLNFTPTILWSNCTEFADTDAVLPRPFIAGFVTPLAAGSKAFLMNPDRFVESPESRQATMTFGGAVLVTIQTGLAITVGRSFSIFGGISWEYLRYSNVTYQTSSSAISESTRQLLETTSRTVLNGVPTYAVGISFSI